MTFEYEVIRSSRRTLSVEIQHTGRVIVRAPRKMKQEHIERFLSDRAEWVESHLQRVKARSARYDYDSYSEEQIQELKKQTRDIVLPMISKFQTLIGVEPSLVRINRAKGRFGSCSGKNSLNFSCFLALYPIEAIEYVVVHELCHIREHNHSPAFYREVERVMPDYMERKRILKEAGYEK